MPGFHETLRPTTEDNRLPHRHLRQTASPPNPAQLAAKAPQARKYRRASGATRANLPPRQVKRVPTRHPLDPFRLGRAVPHHAREGVRRSQHRGRCRSAAPPLQSPHQPTRVRRDRAPGWHCPAAGRTVDALGRTRRHEGTNVMDFGKRLSIKALAVVVF